MQKVGRREACAVLLRLKRTANAFVLHELFCVKRPPVTTFSEKLMTQQTTGSGDFFLLVACVCAVTDQPLDPSLPPSVMRIP